MAHPRNGRPARLGDIAREAGVHVSTVSRVLSGRGDASIRLETKRRIFDSAERLRYRPNALARGLRLSTTGALGWLVPSLRNPINSPIIRGAFDRAWELGYVLMIAEDSDGRVTADDAYERFVEEGRIDGLVIQSAREGNTVLDSFVGGPVPCIFVDRCHPGSGCNVAMRDADAGRLAAEHLLGLGHVDIGHLAGPLEVDTTRRRHDGFVSELAAAGRRARVEVAELSEQAGYDGIMRLLDHDPGRPTAVFVANVNQTIGALAALRQLGVVVPRDLSLICHDDDAVLDYVDPRVTAIRMPLLRLGAVAVDTLVARIQGEQARDILIDEAPALVERASTAPLR